MVFERLLVVVVDEASYFARRGFIVVSIDYRTPGLEAAGIPGPHVAILSNKKMQNPGI